MSPGLHSDHTSYLVWRYLQEHGFARTAAQLSREWADDPQTLPFATDVEPNALVSLLQDGLAYDEIRVSLRNGDRRYSFVELSRKHRTHGLPDNYQPGMNGDDGGARRRAHAEESHVHNENDVMDVDGDSVQDDNLDNRDEMEIDADTVPILQSTIEAGGKHAFTQSDKLPDKPLKKSVAQFLMPMAEIMSLKWHLSDPTLLHASGKAICRSWRIPTSQRIDQGGLTTDFVDDIPQAGLLQDFRVAAVDHSSSSGEMAAVVEDGVETRLVLGSKSLDLARSQALIVRWSKSGSTILLIRLDREKTAQLSIIDVDTFLEIHTSSLDKIPLDATWFDDTTFVLCGEAFIRVYSIEESPKLENELENEACGTDDQGVIEWDRVIHDTESNLTILGASRSLGIFAHHKDKPPSLSRVTPHEGELTALEWQPLKMGIHIKKSPRVFATGSNDGSVKLWEVGHDQTPAQIHIYNMDPAVSVEALAFSHDGLFLAASGDGHINVWKVPSNGKLMATWSLADRPRTNGNTADHDEDPEQDGHICTLSWNSEGNKLAFGYKDTVHVIDLRQNAIQHTVL